MACSSNVLHASVRTCLTFKLLVAISAFNFEPDTAYARKLLVTSPQTNAAIVECVNGYFKDPSIHIADFSDAVSAGNCAIKCKSQQGYAFDEAYGQKTCFCFNGVSTSALSAWEAQQKINGKCTGIFSGSAYAKIGVYAKSLLYSH